MKQEIIRVTQKYKFRKSFRKFYKLSEGEDRLKLAWNDRHPCLDENTTTTSFDRHYIYHPAWAARIVIKTAPTLHIDISSSLTFCSMLSATIPVEFYDFRPARLLLSGLKSEHADLLNLKFEENSILSLSCMHTVEHIGLGRYGDALDYDGDLKAMSELARVLAIGGNLIFVVPIGNRPTIRFNAHRIYSKEQITKQFNKLGLKLVEFTLIPEDEADGGLVFDPSRQLLEKQNYGCGCFWFTK